MSKDPWILHYGRLVHASANVLRRVCNFFATLVCICHVFQVSKGPKQLKGILKGGKSNITSNPMVVPADSASFNLLQPIALHQQHSTRQNSQDSNSTCSDTPPPLTDATIPPPPPSAVHISKAPKPPLRTSSSMNSKNVSEALHV